MVKYMKERVYENCLTHFIMCIRIQQITH